MLSTLLLLASAFAGSLCNDGWVSPSTGPGTCSHHGGIAGGGSYYIPPSIPRASSTSTYRLPPPADELGAWAQETVTTNSGSPAFTAARQYTNFSPSLKVTTFAYACFPDGGRPIGETVLLTVARAEKGYDPRPPESRADASDPYLQVWALSGPHFKRLYSWSAWVDDKILSLGKNSNNIIGGHSVPGVIPLTEEDIAAIIASDKLIVFVTSTTGVEEFEIPMMGAATNIAATRAQCAQAAAAN